MKTSYLLILILTASYLSACGSSNAQKAEPKPSPGGAASVPSGGDLSGNRAVNSVDNSNRGVMISNAGPPTDSGSIRSNSGADRIRNRQRERVDLDPSAPPPPPTFQPAPENSEFAAQMEKGGGILELRVFKSHPLLKKVEIRWSDPQTRSLKVTLKSGKIVERQAINIANLRTVSSNEILDIIGIPRGHR